MKRETDVCPHCGGSGVEPGTIVISPGSGFGFNSLDPDPLDRGSYVPCKECFGGQHEHRDALFARSKKPGEDWQRFSAEVPPELAAALDSAQRNSLGNSPASREGIVRAALRLYLDEMDPLEP